MASTVASRSVDRYVNPQVASAVIRLLAIALQVVQTSERSPDADAPLVPENAWTWPSVTSTLLTHGRRWPVKFAVNPKTLMVSDSRAFPVGSALLVETGEPDVMLDPNIVRPLARVASRFIMIRSIRASAGSPCERQSGGEAMSHKPWLRVHEAAELLCVSGWRVYRGIEEGPSTRQSSRGEV